jgi:Spy/CpxP family protein refolding chaperone
LGVQWALEQEIDMKFSRKLAIGAAAVLGLAAAVAVFAHPGAMGQGMGPGMMGGMGPEMMRAMMGQGHDAAFRADMGLVHEMLGNHERIERKVSNLPDGIRTVTESDDPQVAQTIKAHVASMTNRLREGREFNLFSPTIPVLFQNKDKIRTKVEQTPKGVIVTQTSDDAKVVAALQAHAAEVSELARDGMIAMMRAARARAVPAADASRSPYAGQQGRGIKSLSDQDVQDLRAGRGMGLAKSAELNRYPGPAHVLQLSERLGLSPQQKARTQAVFDAMESQARALGGALIEREAELDRMFASRQVTRAALESSLAEISKLQGGLRRVHLEAHLAQADILTREQVAAYVELRGYGGAGNAVAHGGGRGH